MLFKPRESGSQNRREIKPVEKVVFPKVDATSNFDRYYQANQSFFAKTFDKAHASAWFNMYKKYFFDFEIGEFNQQKIVTTTVQEFINYYSNFRYTDWRDTMNIRKDRLEKYEILLEKLQKAIE